MASVTATSSLKFTPLSSFFKANRSSVSRVDSVSLPINGNFFPSLKMQSRRLQICCAHKPASFPFEIEDNLGEGTILLTRKYRDEVIEVEVDIPTFPSLEDSDDEDEDEKEESISIRGTVCEVIGGPRLQFKLIAFPNEIVIDSFSIKHSEDSYNEIGYEGPHFKDLDKSLQKALREYLEVRGINTRNVAFLFEYMTNKDMKEYSWWLVTLKKFIEK